jgi:hypothetical protein
VIFTSGEFRQSALFEDCSFGDNKFDRMIIVSAEIFCSDMIERGHLWFEKSKDNAIVKANLPRKATPNGLRRSRRGSVL